MADVMSSFPTPCTTDIFASFGSNGQSDLDFMTELEKFDSLGPFDFETVGLTSSPAGSSRATSFKMDDDDVFSNGVGQHGFDVSLNATPTSMESALHTPLTSTPTKTQLDLPSADDIYFPSFLSPISGLDMYSNPTSPMHDVKEDGPVADLAGNALGFFGGLDEPALLSSPPVLLPDLFHCRGDEHHARTPVLSGHSLFSPAMSTYPDLGTNAKLSSTLDGIVGIQTSFEKVKEDFNPVVINPERLYPTPFTTPQRPSPSLPPVATRNSKAGKAQKARDAASKRLYEYNSVSASPVIATPFKLSGSRSRPLLQEGETFSGRSSDECEFGWRVLAAERGRRIEKWKCRYCGTLVGRRPDLHRHYKTCVTREKRYCEDVYLSDGTVWPGCGEKFSRRDACHRHLRKRLVEGLCIRKEPKRERFRNEDDYQRKMALYENMILNQKWRAKLPFAEKNKLARMAIPDMKQDMF